jgi:hypothetical protein
MGALFVAILVFYLPVTAAIQVCGCCVIVWFLFGGGWMKLRKQRQRVVTLSCTCQYVQPVEWVGPLGMHAMILRARPGGGGGGKGCVCVIPNILPARHCSHSGACWFWGLGSREFVVCGWGWG